MPSLTNPMAEMIIRNETLTVVDMMKEVGAGVFVIPFVAILGNVAIAKAFGRL